MRRELAALPLPPAGGRVRRVRPEQYHVTLRFLGDVEPERIDAIARALAERLAPVAPFSYRVVALDAFRRRGGGGVVVARLEPTGPWRALHDAVEAALRPLGFEPEGRPFVPHVTLARVRSGRIGEPAGLWAKPIAEGRVSQAALVRSWLRPDGPVYRDLARFPLGERRDAGRRTR